MLDRGTLLGPMAVEMDEEMGSYVGLAGLKDGGKLCDLLAAIPNLHM